LKAKLEPFLGFMHSDQFGKPSLICDLMELYRFLIDDFLIRFSRKLTEKDFTYKTEWFSSNKMGKREVLNKEKTQRINAKTKRLF
jgi:CRISPR-associated protein Cas1